MKTSIKERPILFSGPMVRAILDGSKTQTRRVVKPQPQGFEGEEIALPNSHLPACPYGVPGDRLWVKETWAEIAHTSPVTMEPVCCEGDRIIEHAEPDDDGGWYYGGKVICYRATSPIQFVDGNGFADGDKDDTPRWKSPLFMPRWASRILLEVTDVRVQRVRDISLADCAAEGALPTHESDQVWDSTATFRDLWDSINAKRGHGWDANPWVWAVTFKPAEPKP